MAFVTGDSRKLTRRLIRPVAPLGLTVAVLSPAAAQSAGPRTIALPPPNATLAAELTRVTAVRELADGRLLIVDRGENKLVLGDWGKPVAVQLGRNGSGPGEYRQPSTLFALSADSTLLADPRNGRWLLLRGPSIVATVGPNAPALRSGARRPLGADDRGHVISIEGIGSGTKTVLPRRDSVLLVRVARANGRADTVTKLRARPAAVKIEGPPEKPTAVSVLANPLAVGESAVLFPDGWIAIARLDPYRVEWIAPDGGRVRGSPLPFERVRLDEREQRGFVERQAARTGAEPRDPRSVPDWPELMPPFLSESLLPGPDGRLWIRRPPTVADPSPPYDVIDRRGALVARIDAGKDVEVVGFGRRAVYTAATDDNGIQHLQRRPRPKF